jgi:hypothetical protein
MSAPSGSHGRGWELADGGWVCGGQRGGGRCGAVASVLADHGIRSQELLCGINAVDLVVAGVGEDGLLQVFGFPSEVLPGERQVADMLHAAGVLHPHGALDATQAKAVRQLIRWNQRHDIAVVAGDEEGKARWLVREVLRRRRWRLVPVGEHHVGNWSEYNT